MRSPRWPWEILSHRQVMQAFQMRLCPCAIPIHSCRRLFIAEADARNKKMFKQLQLLFRTKRSRPVKRLPQMASDPFLQGIWMELRTAYYPSRPDLDDYIITWSSRQQKRVLASCNIRRRRVVVARELFEPSAVRWIAPVLYHELCHAVLGESIITPDGRRLWHGAEFKALEARHPEIPYLNAWITAGGWAMAVRSSRSRTAWARRRGSQAVSAAFASRRQR